MRQGKSLIALLVAGGLFTSTAQANIIYSIDRSIGNGSVKGHITTDGTLGRLSELVCDSDYNCTNANQLLDWSFTLEDGHGTYQLDKWDSDLFQEGSGAWGLTNFYATESTLSYDFGAVGFALFQRYLIGDGGPNWCLGQCGSSPSPFMEEVYAGPDSYEYDMGDYYTMYDSRAQRAGRSSIEAIGWVEGWEVPGPHSLAILAIGLAGIAGSRTLKRG